MTGKRREIPGTMVKKRGRWYWCVTPPGESGRKTIALRPDGAPFATRDKAVAREVASQLWSRWLAESKPAATRRPAEVQTVAELAALYQQQADQEGWTEAKRHVTRLACGSFATLHAIKSPPDIQPSDLIEWRRHICEQGCKRQKGKTKKPLGVRTVNRKVRAVVAMFDWAVEVGACPASVAYGLRCVRPLTAKSTLVRAPEERLGVKPRDVAEVLRLLTPELADMVRLQWRTGMRSGELVQLAWSDIDTSRDIWLFRPKRWKGSGRVGARRRPRIIALGARCQKILAKYGNRQGAIFSPATSEAQRLAAMHKARTTRKSCGNRPGTNRKERPQKKPGTQWDAGSYGKAVRKAIKRAFDDGRISEKWTPHQLRHSAGERVRAKFGLDSASAYLGHKDVETTKIYAEIDVRKATEVAARLG